MKKLMTLIVCCLMTAMSYAQTKTLAIVGTPTTFEITTEPVSNNGNVYQSLTLINHTSNEMTVSFDMNFYWSTEPNTPRQGDEVYQFTLGPNETLSGNTQLLKWASGPISDTRLVNISITNIILN